MKILPIVTAILLSQYCLGQYDYIPVHPDKEGTVLYEAVVEDFKPDTVLSSRRSKDVLYGDIFLENNIVRCIYSGMDKFLQPGADPSTFLFAEGDNNDINLEHCYPQGKGAGFGNAQSDMHHLFPCRIPVNTARGSKPFAEIPDNETTDWYYDDRSSSNIPYLNIELYAENSDLYFEPREDAKGNVARAYFYFFTMYRDQALGEAPDFFASQQATICQWHQEDPVDSLEWHRTYEIAGYQYDKPNPFVLDCTLARMYCEDIDINCGRVSIESSPNSDLVSIKRNGNHLFLEHEGSLEDVTLEIYNLSGQLIQQNKITADDSVVSLKQRIEKLVVCLSKKGTVIYSRIL